MEEDVKKVKKIKLTPLTKSEKRRVEQILRGRVEPCRNVILDGKENCFMGENPSTGKLPYYADSSRRKRQN